MILMKNCSRSACLFDCMLKFALSECMCIPWSLPIPDDVETNLCHSYGSACFYTKLANITYLGESCHCLPGCNHIRYSYNLETSRKIMPQRAKNMCQTTRPFWKYANLKFAKSLHVFQMLNISERYILQLLHNLF